MKKLIFYLLIFFAFAKLDAQWVQVWNGMGQTRTVTTTCWNNNQLVAGAVTFYNGHGIYISTNEGLTWSLTSLNNKDVWDLIYSTSNYIASTENGIYISNDGNTWTNFALSGKEVYETAVNNNYMFAGLRDNGVYYSTNNGAVWTQSFLNNKSIWSLAVYNNNVIAGTYSNGIYYSNDNGYVWYQSNLPSITVERIKFDGTIAYAGTENGIYKSTNFGVNWVQFGLSGKSINDFVFNGQYIYAATDNNGIYVSTKQGLTWNLINEGFPAGNFTANSLTFTNNYLITGLSDKSVWRRFRSEVDVKRISKIVPSCFILSQNYPNPFNPTTTIKFDIPKSDNVKILIFDVLGKEVALLLNEKLSHGSYSVDWNALDYPSGVYFYRMQTENFTETKQMILLK